MMKTKNEIKIAIKFREQRKKEKKKKIENVRNDESEHWCAQIAVKI